MKTARPDRRRGGPDASISPGLRRRSRSDSPPSGAGAGRALLGARTRTTPVPDRSARPSSTPTRTRRHVPDTIFFDIPGDGVHTITPLTDAPSAHRAHAVSAGTTQTGYFEHSADRDRRRRRGGPARWRRGRRATVEGLVRPRLHGRDPDRVRRQPIEACYIGTDATGTVAAGNGTGILIQAGADENTIGGHDATPDQPHQRQRHRHRARRQRGQRDPGEPHRNQPPGGVRHPQRRRHPRRRSRRVSGSEGCTKGTSSRGTPGRAIDISLGTSATIVGNVMGIDFDGRESDAERLGHPRGRITRTSGSSETRSRAAATRRCSWPRPARSCWRTHIGETSFTGTRSRTARESSSTRPPPMPSVGGVALGEANIIAYNRGTGVTNHGVRNAIRGNSISATHRLGHRQRAARRDAERRRDARLRRERAPELPVHLVGRLRRPRRVTVHGILKATP